MKLIEGCCSKFSKTFFLVFLITLNLSSLLAQDFKNPILLFEQNNITARNIAGISQPVAELHAITAIQKQILEQKPDSLIISLPVDGKNIQLLLKQVEVFAPGAIINTLEGAGLATPVIPIQAVYYRGRVAGDSTMVALAIYNDEISGLIELKHGSWQLGHLKKQQVANAVHYLVNTKLIDKGDVFACYTKDDKNLKRPSQNNLLQRTANTMAVGYPVDMYIETDYMTFTNNGNSVAEVTKWAAGVMNIVEGIYSNENIKVQIKTLNIWTTSDPYINNNTTSTALTTFSNRMSSGFSGDLAHLLKQSPSSGPGGEAYVDVLCDANNYKTGVTMGGATTQFLPVNDYNWTCEVATHEIGHNLGSPHTHKCGFWAGGTAIDICGPTAGYSEGSCTGPMPATGGGTIMSYCHMNAGIRFSNGFGTQPGNLIRSKVAAATCLNNCNNLTVTLTSTNATCSQLGTATVTVSGGTGPFTITWSTGKIDVSTTSTVTGLAKGNYTVKVAGAGAGCQVIKGFTITEVLGACPSIIDFNPKNAPEGSTVTLTGSNFTNATTVKFGNKPATSFTINNSSTIKAIVDAGESGNISVTNASGTGAIAGFSYCPTTSKFTNATSLGTITANYSTSGNNFNSNCFSDQFRINSTPGNPSARAGADVFYKFTTGPCVFNITIGVCTQNSGDSFLWLLDSLGRAVTYNDDDPLSGCSSTLSSSLQDMQVMPNTTYYIVVESFAAFTDISWNLSITPNPCLPPTITNLTPSQAAPSDSVTITGTNFTNAYTTASSVKFNGVPAGFTTYSGTLIKASLPLDAASGRVSVTTKMGTAYSSINFLANTSATGIVTICPLGTANLKASSSGSNYIWQVHKGEGFVTLSNNANYSNTNTSTLTITNAPTYWYGYLYRCLVDNVPGNYITLKFHNYFTGVTNSNWETLTNWGCPAALPDANTDVIVNEKTAIVNQDAFARSLTATTTINAFGNVEQGAVVVKQNKNLMLGLIHQNRPLNKLMGGQGNDMMRMIKATKDGGYIMAGYSNSLYSGAVNTTYKEEVYLVKLNAYGVVEWTQIYGGREGERANDIIQTSDGGFIIAGYTQYYSPSFYNKDVTGFHHGSYDYWIIKIDGGGAMQWNKLYGGDGYEEATSIKQTADGGYIVAGKSSSSANGDISGTSNGGIDYWILKLDATGNKQWDKLYGGAAEDNPVSIAQTSDNEYIVVGTSRQTGTGYVPTGRGFYDYWMLKLNASGNIIFNKCFGGNALEEAESMTLTADGGCIITGLSGSSANGDVTEITKGSVDYWTLKLDSDGNIVFNKLHGGNQSERAKHIINTADGGYLIVGYSGSSASGNVTGTLSGANTYDYWALKIDANGAVQWNKLLGGTGYDLGMAACQTIDGNYVIAGYTDSNNSGALVGLTNNGANDTWIIKLDKNGNVIN
jgi:hypothetical protein